MPLLLRKIDLRRWDMPADPSWVPQADIHADPLADLTTKENALSVWHVEDDRSNLKQVITALASNCQSPSKIDYILFSSQILSKHNITSQPTKANTPYESANHFHRDLTHLSASKVVQLAKELLTVDQKLRVQERHVEEYLKEAWSLGDLKQSTLQKDLRARLEKTSRLGKV